MEMEELLRNIQIQIEKNNQEMNSRLDRIEEDNKEIKGRLDRIEKDNQEIKSEMKVMQKDNKEIKSQMKIMQEDNKEIKSQMKIMQENNKEIKSQMKIMQEDNKEYKNNIDTTMKEVKDQIHMIKDVNLSHILQHQIDMKEELKAMIKDIGDKLDKGTKILEDYIQRHEVEHSKINYEIADLQWKTKIAN